MQLSANEATAGLALVINMNHCPKFLCLTGLHEGGQ